MSFSKTRYRQCVVYGAKAIQFMQFKDLICISVSEMSHLCPLQVLNISNAHAHLAYNTVQDSGCSFPGASPSVVHEVSVAI